MMWIVLAAAAVAVGMHVAAYRTWHRVAERLGLHFGEGSFWGDWEIYGEVRGCRVQVRNLGELWSRKRRFTRISVMPPRRISTDLELAPETLLGQAAKLLTGEDLRIGDRAFDGKVKVGGREEVVYAVLDARARPTVLRFIETWRGQVAGGEVMRDSTSVLRSGETIEKLVLDAVRVAEALQAPAEGYTAALLSNLAQDPQPAMRLKCLELLLKQPGPVADEAIRVASVDADPEVMLAAADAAGPRGVALLRQLAASARIPGDVAERALLRLSELDTAEAAEVARAIALEAPRATTARALELAGHLGLADLAPRLVQFTRHPDGALATAAAHGLAALGVEADAALVVMLGHASAEARHAAVEALAEVGTLAAVKPLLAEAERGTVPRKDARAAVARIQGRHARGDAGSLAVVDEEAGGLAVVEEVGRLSVVGVRPPTRERIPE